MKPGRRYDLVIIGMGSAGMVAAEFAATLGIRCAVVERGRVGGDCLWTGCVPSKSLLASAKVAHAMATAGGYGIAPNPPQVDLVAVWQRIRRIQGEIAAGDDDPGRFEDMGVEIIRSPARIVGPHRVEVDGRVLETRYILLCTGSRPVVPAVEGLEDAGFLTSEQLFEIEQPPSSITMIGGGPISIEMAQAFVRLGIRTTVLQKGQAILPRDEPELVSRLADALRAEGVELCLDVEIRRATARGGNKVLEGTMAGAAMQWESKEIFLGAGRRPNIEGTGAAEIGVEVGARGVVVDDRMRTTVPSVYAVGDLAGRALFTHAAGYQAVRALRDMFFPGRGKADAAIPWCTFTDPELAHAGMTEAEAREAHGDGEVEVFARDLTHSDRARADGATGGRVVVVTASGTIVGAHVLAPGAGEMIHELALAMYRGMKLRELAGMVHVYPTLSTTVSQLAGEAVYESIRRYRWLARLGRWRRS